MPHESLKQTLEPVLRVLRDLGGKFVFTDESGETFVLTTKKELKRHHQSETQLSLPTTESVEKAVRKHVSEQVVQDVLDTINRDIALATSEDQQVVFDDLAIEKDVPFKRIRFEALKGDLSPDLQD